MLSVGEIVEGKYRVLRAIGEGGMGIVYEGQNLRIGRRVAIKVMHTRLTTERDLVVRFEREALAAARVDSAHVVDVLDMGDLPNGHRYMVMDFLDGESLHARLKSRGVLEPEQAAPIVVQLLEGLARVHAAGIIHRDLKPHNIFLVRSHGASDFVKILDFGLCKMLSPDGAADLKTGVGNMFGTVPYMAPEHFEQGARMIDSRSDLYSVGIVLFRCITGQLPSRATNVLEMVMHLREGRPPKVRDVAPHIDTGFAAIVDRAISRDALSRYQDADSFRRALLDWMESTARLDELITFLETAPEANPYEETQRTLPAARAPVPPIRDLAPTLHAEEEVARIAATTAEPDDGPETNRLARAASAARGRLPTQEEIPVDHEAPQEDSKSDFHDEMNTVEMRTIFKRNK